MRCGIERPMPSAAASTSDRIRTDAASVPRTGAGAETSVAETSRSWVEPERSQRGHGSDQSQARPSSSALPWVEISKMSLTSSLARAPNVSLLSCGRIRKPRAVRKRRPSPWYITTGEREDGAGHDEARPSASTACWAALALASIGLPNDLWVLVQVEDSDDNVGLSLRPGKIEHAVWESMDESAPNGRIN